MSEPRNFIRVDVEGPCWVCGDPTKYVELNYGAHLHLRCEAEADRQFWNAVAQ